MKARHYNDTLQQALNYAAADRSDPFAFARAMAHSANGICDSGPDGKNCRYKAEPVRGEYGRIAYTNVQRP